jgi:GT2 family glycosyltransferase
MIGISGEPTLKRMAKKQYYRLRDYLLPLGTKRRLSLILLVEHLLRQKKPISASNMMNLLTSIYNLIVNEDVAEEDVRRKLADRLQPTVIDSLGTVFEPGLDVKTIEPIYLELSETPVVSIIIPVLNQWVYTYSCLRAISLNAGAVPYEVIVVDNGSDDETKAMLTRVRGLRVITNSTNLGFVSACNAGAKTSRGSSILFLNNDAMLTPGLLKNSTDLMFHDETIGLVGCKLVYPDGKLQEAGGIVWNDRAHMAWNYGKFDSPGKWEYNYVKETDYCSGACLLARREAFFHVGAFDSDFMPAYCEDTGLAFSMRKAGYKVVYQPSAVAVHFEGITAGTDTRKGLKSYQLINQEKFCDKWGEVLSKEHFENGEHIYLARDRSRDRRIILYVDHQIPTWDRDAGSFITYQYLKLFCRMGFKIVFWPANLEKIEPYTFELQQMGIEVVYGYGNFEGYMKKYGRYMDCMFLSRPFTARRFIEHVKTYSRAPVFYVAHDLHYLREMRRAELEKNRRLARFARKLKKLELSLGRRSNAILVFSSQEKQLLEDEDPGLRVETMPWIQGLQKNERTFDDRRDLMFIGSFVHLPNQDAILWFVQRVFPLIKQRVAGIRLVVVGNSPTEPIMALNGDDVVVTGFVHDPSDYFAGSRIFVAPLRYGAGMKGKIIQAMSYGLPVVTTPIGAEGIELQHGVNAVIAEKPEDMAQEIVKLYRSRALWETLSHNSMAYVHDNNSPQRAEDWFNRILRTRNE